MIQINWKIFENKFEGKETSAFEDLAYILFCLEHNIENGIFAYRNQVGIETEPIKYHNELIGFQSKYYNTTKVSDNKSDMKDSIKKAKQKNRELTKIFFYIKGNISESTKEREKKPEYQTEIENYAKELNIYLVWKTKSQIEFQLMKPKNKYYRNIFFENDDIIKFLEKIEDHNKLLFDSIEAEINFKDNNIKIDRENELDNIKNSVKSSDILILRGEAGCGKTAIIKDLNSENETPFYIFEVEHFDLDYVDSFFNRYGNYSIKDFQKIHEKETNKIIVIDSAEKIINLHNTSIFTNFLQLMIKDSWKIILTTRDNSYIDLLKLINKFKTNALIIQNLNLEKLNELSISYKFKLPNDKKLKEFLTKLFYLNEYLQILTEENTEINDIQIFKEKIWEIKVLGLKNSRQDRIKRESCFLRLIKKKSDENLFLVNLNEKYYDILSNLENEEIIAYNNNQNAFFVTHDIYEELALERIIHREFKKAKSFNEFFRDIGNSLSMQKAFKEWLIKQLNENSNDIDSFLEYVILDKNIEEFWKKETIISILLSDYPKSFFEKYENEILKDEKKLLEKITSLLKMACTEIANGEFSKIISKIESISDYFYTNPKGNGWIYTIYFIEKNLNKFEARDMDWIMPILKKWNNNNNKGTVTRKSSLIALYFYKKIQERKEFNDTVDNDTVDNDTVDNDTVDNDTVDNDTVDNDTVDNDTVDNDTVEESLIEIIFEGALEIKNELKEIFEKVLDNKWKNFEDPHYTLCRNLLKDNTTAPNVLKSLPSYVLKIADLYWYKNTTDFNIRYDKDKNPFFHEKSWSLDIDNKFSINELSELSYSSSFQTPILLLLKYFTKETIEFIINFTNKTIAHYVASEKLDNEKHEKEKNSPYYEPFEYDIETIKIRLNGKTRKQYISDSLWNIYRGTGGKITPSLLQSIHMALEKFLLELSKFKESDVENVLIYILKNSKSASLTSIVNSIVLYNPNKFFNVAKALFKTIKLFPYDAKRSHIYENEAKTLYNMASMSTDPIFIEERLDTCKDSHRKFALGQLIIIYYFNLNNSITEDELQKRKTEIEKIIDFHYKQLEENNLEKEEKKLRILSNIDPRNIKPKAVKLNNGAEAIYFEPELPQDLQKISKNASDAMNKDSKYQKLRIWSEKKLNNEKINEIEFNEYDNNPKLVLKEIKEILILLKNNNENFSLFNKSIPITTSCVLIRDYGNELSPEDKKLCKNLIIKCINWLFDSLYSYQISGGALSAIETLPYLFKIFPDENDEFIRLLVLLLFNTTEINLSHEKMEVLGLHFYGINDFIATIIKNHLWDYSPEISNKILFEYNKWVTKFELINKQVIKENFNRNKYTNSYSEAIQRFFERYDDKFMNISLEDNFNISKLDLFEKNTIFQALPDNTNDKIHLKFIKEIVSTFSKTIFDNENDYNDSRQGNYKLRSNFLRKLAGFILNRPKKENIKEFIQPFIDNFKVTKETKDLFDAFISLENKAESYDNFWEVWNIFYDKIYECSELNNYYSNEIIRFYLLDGPYWCADFDWDNWYLLKERESTFFYNISKNMGNNKTVLISIAKFLNMVGRKYTNKGVTWISDIINENSNLHNEKFEKKDITYLEKYCERYIKLNNHEISKNPKIKKQILEILDFLIEKESNVAYSLREQLS